jgi:hypothetical protein
MGAEKKPREQHVSTTTLWDYRIQRRLLFRDEILHLYNCDDCLSRFDLCQRSQRFEEVESRLRKPRFNRERAVSRGEPS